MRRDLESLTPKAAALCRKLLLVCEARGLRLTLTSTLRSATEQAALYAQGRRTLNEVNALRETAGLSPIKDPAENRVVTHSRTSAHQSGLAFDVAVLDSEGRPDWQSTARYAEVGMIGEGLGLRWGGRFRSRDLCHFELASDAGAALAAQDKTLLKEGTKDGAETGLQDDGVLGDTHGRPGAGAERGARAAAAHGGDHGSGRHHSELRRGQELRKGKVGLKREGGA